MQKIINPYRIGFIVEQALGHATHAQNLRASLLADPTIHALWAPIPYDVDGLAARLPLYSSNWTVRAGLRARRALASMQRSGGIDALFVHTQVPATLTSDWLRRVPSVVSLDATPLQYDALGEFYNHAPGPYWLEQLKWLLSRASFRAATQLVAWSAWARASLCTDYGIESDKITVIPPGVHVAAWRRSPRVPGPGPVRLLFVGGDLERKGGSLLLEAFRRLRADYAVELHLVTKAQVAPEPGLVVYNDMQPNSAALKQLYHDCEIFCLPTNGDCLPMVLSEAAAAGLPCVSTTVAAIPELVRHGETGLLVPPGDLAALTAALQQLIQLPWLRLQMGDRAEAVARHEFDAGRNAARLLDLIRAVADNGRASHPTSRASHSPAGGRVLISVSGVIDPQRAVQVAAGKQPRADYLELAQTVGGDLLDYAAARYESGLVGHALGRLGGRDLLLALACFRQRRRYRTILSDGEQVGLPLAWLLKYWGGPVRPRHVMITHVLSPRKKRLLIDAFRLHSHIDQFIVYASAQQRLITRRWGLAPERVSLTPFMVDADFFAPAAPAAGRQICAVGLERRDYPTLVAAVRGLNVDLVIAAASPWSKRDDGLRGEVLPPNVRVQRFSQDELRRLYAESRFLVMPLHEVDFQAGVTAMLEAMAMARPVIVSATAGQTDVVVEGVTGVYVPPGDVAALRAAILHLLDDPETCAEMGAAGRRLVEDELAIEHYTMRLAAQLCAMSSEVLQCDED